MRSWLFAALLASGSVAYAQSAEVGPPHGVGQKPAFAGQTRAPLMKSGVAFTVETVVSGLEHPWAVEALGDGRLLVTEKPGRLRVVTKDGKLLPPIAGVPAVMSEGQGGLLDVALKPTGAGAWTICLTYAEPREGGKNGTTASCGKAANAAGGNITLSGMKVVFRQMPAWDSKGHFGSRYVFAPDGDAFVTMGERQKVESRNIAQQMDNTLGKVVHLRADGTPEIWSKGHRNVQAAAINPATGKLWTIEHGPMGGDELNIPEKGKNYGWPVITYGIDYNGKPINEGITAKAGMEQPVYYWDPVIAPGGMAFYTGSAFPKWRGSLFVGGLASQQLVRLTLKGDRVIGEERFPMPGRVRDVITAPDGAIYMAIDDKGTIIRVVPKR